MIVKYGSPVQKRRQIAPRVAKVVAEEQKGIYKCAVWRLVTGSRVTYKWIDEDGIKRFELQHSTRPALMQYYANGDAYVTYRGEVLKVADFYPLSTPVKIGKRTFTHCSSDTMFSGYYIDVPEDGEVCYVARILA